MRELWHMVKPNMHSGHYNHLTSLGGADFKDTIRFGNKAANLSRMIQNGISVPHGYVLTSHAFDVAQCSGELPDAYIDDVMRAIEELGGRIAIRSSATVEDGEDFSMAGVFETNYAINGSRDSIRAFINDAYHQALSADVAKLFELYGIVRDDIKLSLIIQRLIEPLYAGVVYATSKSNKVTVQYVSGYGQDLVNGVKNGTTILINKHDGTIEDSINFDNNPMPRSLVRELLSQTKKIVKIFDNTEQDIEFAVSKEQKLYIVQARPLTRILNEVDVQPTLYDGVHMARERAINVITKEMAWLGTHKAVLHLNNFAELMPNPTPMDIGTFKYVFTGFEGHEGAIQLSRRRMGYPSAETSIGYLHYIGGKAYESLAGDAGSFYCGFPETEQEYVHTLVNDYLDSVYDDPTKAAYPQMGLYVRNPSLKDLSIRYGQQRAVQYMDTYQKFRTKIDGVAGRCLRQFPTTRLAQHKKFVITEQSKKLSAFTTHELVLSYYDILGHLREQSAFDFDTAAHLAFYYVDQLKHLLVSHSKLDSGQINETLLLLTQGLDSSTVTEDNLAICSASSNEEALEIAKKRIYHYPVTGEILEIHNARLGDSLKQMRAYVRGLRTGEDYGVKFAHQKAKRLVEEKKLLSSLKPDIRAKFVPVIERAQRYMALRETLKDQLTKEYVLLRQRLTEIERRTHLKQGTIFYLYPHELTELISSPQAVQHLIDARVKEYNLYQAIYMPPLIRHDTIHAITYQTSEEEVFTEAVGQLIATGEAAEGILVNVDELTTNDDQLMKLLDSLRKKGEHVILVAQTLNLTHDPYINKSKGLVLQQAGFVSHGAQRARELGVGALSSIDTSVLHTGTRVLFDPPNKLIRNLSKEPS